MCTISPGCPVASKPTSAAHWRGVWAGKAGKDYTVRVSVPSGRLGTDLAEHNPRGGAHKVLGRSACTSRQLPRSPEFSVRLLSDIFQAAWLPLPVSEEQTVSEEWFSRWMHVESRAREPEIETKMVRWTASQAPERPPMDQ